MAKQVNRVPWPVVALLIAAAGCGGGTDGTPVAPPAAPAPTPPPPPAPPGQPTGIRVVDVGLDFLVWAWDPVEGATSYEAHAFPDGTPPSERPPLLVTVEPTFRADGLEPGTVMGILVRAIRETAAGRAVGPWSDQGTGETLTPPPPPMTVTGTVRASGGPASVVAGAVVQARNLGTGAVDGEATTDMDGSYAIEGLRGDRYSIEVMPPSGYLSAAPVLVNRPESGDLELSADILAALLHPPRRRRDRAARRPPDLQARQLLRSRREDRDLHSGRRRLRSRGGRSELGTAGASRHHTPAGRRPSSV